MALLLVSVRSEREARAAFKGGAGLIDVKEPPRGGLGRADDATIAAVIRSVAGRLPVSAANGELLEGAAPFPGEGLAFIKWGLAGCSRRRDWRTLLEFAAGQKAAGAQAVAVAYADWRRAQAPQPGEVADFACQNGWNLLIDTWRKDGKTLLDWMSLTEIIQLCQTCRRAGVGVALAGSLREEHIRALEDAQPDWFAVRAAACRDGEREQEICQERVRRLVEQCRMGWDTKPEA